MGITSGNRLLVVFHMPTLAQAFNKPRSPASSMIARFTPEASKLMKSVRVAKSGKAIKWAFREPKALAGRLLE